MYTLPEGFYKVAQTGGTYVVATFFNPTTCEVLRKCVRDYDYNDCSRDIDELYYMSIDEEVKVKYMHFKGILLVGDQIEVVKGRKVPIGTIAIINDIRPYKDRYGRIQAYYAYLSNGMKTNINNCVLVK